MILGVGNDVCNIKRIENSIHRFGDRFINRIFTKIEIQKANKRIANYQNYISTFAKIFAAKEAVMKAIGTGYAKGLHFNKINISNDNNGKPVVILNENVIIFIKNMINNKDFKIHLTLSDDYPYAFAVAVVEVI